MYKSCGRGRLSCGGLLQFILLESENRVNHVNQLFSILIDTDRIDDLKRAAKDRSYQEQLMSELLPIEVQKI